MSRNKFSVAALRIIAVFFLVIAIIVWIYGSGSHRSIDALLVGIAAIGFFLLSFYMSKKKKEQL